MVSQCSRHLNSIYFVRKDAQNIAGENALASADSLSGSALQDQNRCLLAENADGYLKK